MPEYDESLLDTILIVDTRLGSAAFRRALKKAGFHTLKQALEASDTEIDDTLSLDDADELDRLRNSFNRNPKEFLAKIMPSSEERCETRDRPSLPKRRVGVNRVIPREAISHTRRVVRQNATNLSMPDDELGRALIAHEQTVRSALDALSDRDDDYLVFETFDDYALEIDDMYTDVLSLFKRYGKNAGYLEQLIRSYIPCLYLVFIANGAREKFDGKNLWGNIFQEAMSVDSSQINRFKALFMECLERRGMPTYAKGERDFYYLYTALLHGGLSKDAWSELWGRVLLPLAKKAAYDPFGIGGNLDGAALLSMIREGEGAASRTKESVKNILGKIPDKTIAPIIEAAFGVAHRLADTGSEGITMITSSGLPPAAIESLDIITRMPVTGLVPKHRLDTKDRIRRIIPIQEGDLYLDVLRGVVLMKWKDQKLPKDYVGYRVEIHVDGRLEKTNEILQGVGIGVLRSCEVEVSPSASYTVEIRLLKPNNGGKEKKFDEVGALCQSFERVHAGCFEFLENAEGSFRLRKRRDRIRRTRTVAFVVKEGRAIRPGIGMSAVESHHTAGAWKGRAIRLFRVEPGASASVVSESDGTVLSAWHESFGNTIHRENIIGHTTEGLDLYGVVPGKGGRNTALPNILIESADNHVAYDDLIATCQCDGKNVDVELSSLEMPGDEYIVTEGVCVRLGNVPCFPTLIEKCVVDVRQRSTDCLVCRYRFAVVPIHRFLLSALWMARKESLQIIALYTFKVLQRVVITNADEVSKMCKNDTYHLKCPLSYESVQLSIKSYDHAKSVTFTLGLAGIEVCLPNELKSISYKKPISAAHAVGYMLDDELTVRTVGNRSNRGIYLTYSDIPLLLGEEPRRIEHRFGLFSDPSVFAFNEHGESNEFSLRLSVSFGMRDCWDGRTGIESSIDLLHFERGLGLTESWLDTTKPDSPTIRFDKPAIVNMFAECYADFSRSGRYRSGQTKRRTFSCEMVAGEDRVEVSREVMEDIRAHRKVTIKLLPIDDFGEPDESYQMELTVRERGDNV